MVTTITQDVFFEWQGERLPLVEASVSQDEGGAFWRVRARLARAGDYLKLSRLDDITLSVFGDEYALVVESLGRSKSQRGEVQTFEVTARSRLWADLGEQAERVTRTWDEATAARTVAEELAGEAIDWRIVNWVIPAGRLAAVNEAPISIIRKIVEAAGGVLESDKDGQLIARYLYPVTIPQVPDTDPDHELTEPDDITLLAERLDGFTRFDKLLLSDELREQGFLSAERDPDQHDEILAGESQRFHVFHSSDVEIESVLVSTGTVLEQGEVSVEVEEEIVFANTNEASLSKPVDDDFEFTWYGDGLGSLTVSADGLKVTAAESGVAVAKVSYTTAAKRYAVRSPSSAGGESVFPIIVYVIGALIEDTPGSGQRRIIVQRGAGELHGDDVVEPLAGSDHVLYQRGRNMIDGATAKGTVSLETGYQDAVLNGQLILVPDTQIGETWRGKVVNVEHRVERSGRSELRVSTSLAVERFL